MAGFETLVGHRLSVVIENVVGPRFLVVGLRRASQVEVARRALYLESCRSMQTRIALEEGGTKLAQHVSAGYAGLDG